MEKPRATSLKNELAGLYAEVVRHRQSLPARGAGRRALEKRLLEVLISPILANGGKAFLRRTARGKLAAAVLFEPADSASRRPASFVLASLPGDRVSLRWVRETVKENQAHLGKRCEGHLELWQRSLMPQFGRAGFAVRGIYLEGDVEKSLRRLRRHYGAALRVPLEAAGVEIRAATSRAEIPPYLEILRKEYRKNPQFGHFVSDPKFLGRLGKYLAGTIRRGEKALWLVYRGERLLGGSDIFVFPKQKRAGFGVNLRTEAQGKQFARALYETILIELEKRGVTHYEGNTGQPGVMRLGKIMGRKLTRIKIDRGFPKPFPGGHFTGWV